MRRPHRHNDSGPQPTCKVLERLEMPLGMGMWGLECDGADQFFCGGGSSAKVRAVRQPRRDSAAKPKK